MTRLCVLAGFTRCCSRIAAVLLAVSMVFCGRGAAAHTGDVMRTIDAPGGFCTGMTFDGRSLWVADDKADRLYRLNAETGEVIESLASPGFWPSGLAWDGTALWNADQKTQKIYQVEPRTGTVLRTIDAPSGHPDGLAWDGETLWVGDSKAKKIMRIDLSDGTAVRTITAPARSADGLCFDGTYLWCSDRLSDEIYMIDPERGEVILIADAPGPYARGLAWDGSCLWNIDYQDDTIYRLVRQDSDPYRLSDTRRARIRLTHQVKVYGTGRLQKLDVFLSVPGDLPQQKILGIKTDAVHAILNGLTTDRWEQSIATFSYADISTPHTIETTLEVEAEISAIRYFIFPDRCGTLADIPRAIREPYTADGSKYRLSDPTIRDLARNLAGDETNPYWIARRIFDHVRNTLEYKLEGGWNTAPVVLQRGTGSCSEYSFSFIALCRAAGLPARYTGAIVVRGDDASLDDVFHRWPEVYLPGYGWVPIDPQGGDKPLARDRAMSIGNLSNRFLISTVGGGDSEYLGWTYVGSERYQNDPQVLVNIEMFADWEPLAEEETTQDTAAEAAGAPGCARQDDRP